MKRRIQKSVLVLAVILFVWLGYNCVDGISAARSVTEQENAVTVMSATGLMSETDVTQAPSPTAIPTLTATPTPTSTPTPAPTNTPTPTPTVSPTPTPIAEINDLVKAALLIDCDADEVVYAYRETEQIVPASITKLMTALLAMENGNLGNYLVATETALEVDCEDATMCGLMLGDRISLENVLYGLLLPSGNEAAEMISEYVSGDVDSFVSLMNERAAELGMTSTHFGNPHGLPCDGHLTSAWDISLLMKELLSKEVFFEITKNKEYEVTFLDSKGKEKSLLMKSTNQYLRGKQALPEGITILGGKTGYTDLAGRCLVLYVKTEEGKLYIAELFGAKDLDTLYTVMSRLLEIVNGN